MPGCHREDVGGAPKLRLLAGPAGDSVDVEAVTRCLSTEFCLADEHKLI